MIHLGDEHVETAENLDLIMNMYNFIEYSDNYSETKAFLYQFKRQEKRLNNAGNIVNINNDSSSFKYKSKLLGTSTNIIADEDPNLTAAHRLLKNAQILVPLKYISNFFRSLELRLINTKLYIELNWTKNSVMSTGDDDSTKFQITKTELYVPVVTLKTADNNKLSELLKKGFKRSVFWNEYKSKIQPQNDNNFKRTLLDSSFQGVNRLFFWDLIIMLVMKGFKEMITKDIFYQE